VHQLDAVEVEEFVQEVTRWDAEPTLDVREEDAVSPVPSVGNSLPTADLKPTFDLGLSSPRSASDWICSSVTMGAS
jgi:hypothetical protein